MPTLSVTDQKLISKLTETVYSNLENENFRVNDLARSSGLSTYRLSRRLYSINKKTIKQFITEVRLVKAHEMLQNEEYSVSEVAYKVGFSSPGYFNKCFHAFFGYPPGKLKKEETNGYELNNTGKKFSKRFILLNSLVVIVCSSVIFFVMLMVRRPGSSNNISMPDGRISLMVLPFENRTNDTLLDVWQEGIQTCLITSLSNYEELQVRQIETINGYLKSEKLKANASMTPSVGSTISQKLNANVFLYGSINHTGSTLRINAQLINSRTEETLRSFHFDGTSEGILRLIDSLTLLVKNSLIISGLKSDSPGYLSDPTFKGTESPEAYKLYIQGNRFFYKNDFPSAIDCFTRALAIDTNLLNAMAKISLSYYNDLKYEPGKKWCQMYYKKKNLMGTTEKIWADFINALYFQTINERFTPLEHLKELDDENPLTYFNIGDAYLELQEYDKAIIEFQKALDIFLKRHTKPFWPAFYYELGIAYHKNGQYRLEKKLYKKAEKDFPNDPGLMDQRAWLALTSGDTVIGNRYIKEWTSEMKKKSWSDAQLAAYLAYIYDMAGDTDMVESSLRQALILEPDNPSRMSSLANFLIDYERGINEGMGLIDKALGLNPDNYNFLQNKGWGLYKLKRYEEALNMLQISWDLRMQNSIYNHKAFLRLEEARKAVRQLELKSN